MSSRYKVLVSSKVIVPLALMIFTCVSRANAQTFNGWAPAFKYATGFNPSVAAFGTTAIEVHNGTNKAGNMSYTVGQISTGGPTIQWGPDYQYAWGYNPSVAINGSTVVEVHNGNGGAGPMWYTVGQVNGSAIQWGSSYKYATFGFNPSVALTSCATFANPNCGLVAVEVHNGSGKAGPLWYTVGQVVGSTIQWGPAYEYSTGFNPSVGIQLCVTNQGVGCGINVFEVHNGSHTAGPMWYDLGTWNSGFSIQWGPGVNYDSGWNPKVAFGYAGEVMEVHNGQGSTGPMWYHYGYWSYPMAVNLGPSYEYDHGFNPSVAIGAYDAVEVDGPNNLWSRVGGLTYP